MTTIDTVTKAQIKALRTEAVTAGDSGMVSICDRALGHFSDQPADEGERDATVPALAECVRVINEAQAQAD